MSTVWRIELPSHRYRPTVYLAVLLSLFFAPLGCHGAGAQNEKPEEGAGRITDIAVGTAASQTGVKRLGMNISGESNYDSGQILKNLVSNNPGFEGELRQSILHCVAVTPTSCTESTPWAVWPENFLRGAQFEFIHGSAAGQTGVVTSSTVAQFNQNKGVTLSFDRPVKGLAVGDYLVVRMTVPGNAPGGWWTSTAGGGSLATETADLAPNTPGKQALRMDAAGPQQSARVDAYFDSVSSRSFLQLHGTYQLSFRAKALGGTNLLDVSFERQNGHEHFFSKTQRLTGKWQDYSYTFPASDPSGYGGTLDLRFSVAASAVLLDDVSLTPVGGASTNTTAFRDEVVSTLTALRPGILRWNDGAVTGNSLDNLIAPQFARMRAMASTQSSAGEDVALGLEEFLELCRTVGAEPYFSMPPGMSVAEARNLIEYLAGDAATPYGSKRAARGQAAPWTKVFPRIHLELGNEEWNGIFPGGNMPDPAAYGARAKAVFTAMRQSAAFAPDKFDLIMGSFFINTDWTKREIAAGGGYDSVAVAPYLYNNLNDASSTEAIFGPMFAQPEMYDSRATGTMVQQAKVVKAGAHPANLTVYEVNLSTMKGTAPQPVVNSTVASVAAGITVVEHMLLMVRDLGIKDQSVWSLSGYSNRFDNPADKAETTPLFGVVVDMGGPTNLRRPQYLAEQLANQAMLPTMLTAKITGQNPTWNQGHSANDGVELEKAHYLQVFPFADGAKRSLIVFNLQRTQAIPVTFSGMGAPSGNVEVSQLTSANITDTNETKSNVAISTAPVVDFKGATPYSLPPFSMTVFEWTDSRR